MADPLAGKREELNRGDIEVLIFPDAPKCPVAKGEVFPLRSCQVEIARTERKFVKGEWRWEAPVRRHTPDTPQIPASQHGQAHPAQYVSSFHGAVDGIGEEVPSDYRRLLAEEGRLKTTMLGNQKRQISRKLEAEERLAGARRKGRASTVRFMERVRTHHERKDAA